LFRFQPRRRLRVAIGIRTVSGSSLILSFAFDHIARL
jgi:hypothetical protein